jgi:autophagy-related protein 11
VFNKFYLDEDFDEVIKLLHLQPPLQPPIEGAVPHFARL